MKIKSLYVTRFGHFAECGWDVPDGLSVWLGPNETGKTTLLDFIRVMIWGRASQGFDRYRGDGDWGGRIDWEEGERAVRLERSGPKRLRLWVDGREETGESLAGLLGHVSLDVFENVYAFGLGELQQFSSLTAEEVAGRIYSAGLGFGKLSVVEVLAGLRARQERLYKARGQKQPIGEAIKRLEELERQLADRGREQEEYRLRLAEQEQLAARLAEIRHTLLPQAQQHRRRAQRIGERQAEAWQYRRLRETASRLQAVPPVGDEDRAVVQKLVANRDEAARRLAEADRRRAALDAAMTADRQTMATWGKAQGSALDDAIRRLAVLSAQHAEAVREAEARWDEIRRQTGQWPPAFVAGLNRAAVRWRELYANAREVWGQAERAREEYDRVVGELRDMESRRDRRQAELRQLAPRVPLAELETFDQAIRALGDRPAFGPSRLVLMLALALLVLGALLLGVAADWLSRGLAGGVTALAVWLLWYGWHLRRAAARDRYAETVEWIGRKLGAEPAVPAILARIGEEKGRAAAAARVEQQYEEAEEGVAALAFRCEQRRRHFEDLRQKAEALWGEIGLDTISASQREQIWQELPAYFIGRDVAEAQARRGERAVEAVDAVVAEWRERLAGWPEPVGLSLSAEPGWSPDAVVREMEKLAERAREARRQMEEWERAEREWARATGEWEEADRALTTCLASHGARSVEEFDAMAEAFRQKCEAESKIADLERNWTALDADERRQLITLTAEDVDRLAADDAHWREEVDRLTAEADALNARIGSLSRQLADMEESHATSALRQQLMDEAAGLNQLFEEWAVAEVALRAIDAARQVFERDRQPTVLRAAADLLAQLTGGRYVRVIAPLDQSRRIHVEDAQGRLKSLEQLSRGTAEQLYFAIRLAWIEEVERQGQPVLPLLLDDILVNFDPVRLARTAAVLAASAQHRQVLLWTCHPHIAEALAAVGATVTPWTAAG